MGKFRRDAVDLRWLAREAVRIAEGTAGERKIGEGKREKLFLYKAAELLRLDAAATW